MNEENRENDVPLVEETPAMKAIREAQERGEDIEVKGDVRDDRKPTSTEAIADPDKTPYEQLQELYSPDKPIVLASFGGNETHEVFVRKCRMKDMGKIIRFAKLLLNEVGKLQEVDSSEVVLDDLQQTALILDVLETNLEETYDLVFNLCSISDREDLDSLDADDGIELILAIVEVNKRFFMQKVAPLVASVLARESI